MTLFINTTLELSKVKDLLFWLENDSQTLYIKGINFKWFVVGYVYTKKKVGPN